ncbi:MAG: 4Fe-4S binding protein [Gammaproteobacteria bacterium]|nr:4Fe-4S binding protein [Gammaproteobacteria bacterium]
MTAATHGAAWPRDDAPAGRLARIGEALRRHRGTIQALQWIVVAVYAVLLVVPVFLPLPPSGATLLTNLTLYAQFVFWGLWWPFVILSMMLLGRVWCGVLCPEGALTELASRHGLGRAIPRWMRWGGWPFVAFALTTLYGQLVSVYQYPGPALLVLGGSTVAAIAVGLVYGRGQRVWCRHLCPVNGVFGLLAKLAPLHFAVDEAAWKRHGGRVSAVDCAPLVDLRRMRNAAHCHACGRCSGHRGAIALSLRAPHRDILAARPGSTPTGLAVLLVFGMLGLALGAFRWSASPWFVALKQAAAGWLVDRGAFALLGTDAPWWLLTHYPQASDTFSWLDGLLITGYILGFGLVYGTLATAALAAAERLAGAGRFDWKSLALGLVPLAGLGLFLGLSTITLGHLRAEGWLPAGIDTWRAALLGGGVLWSVWLGARIVAGSPAPALRRAAAFACYLAPVALAASSWLTMFRRW